MHLVVAGEPDPLSRPLPPTHSTLKERSLLCSVFYSSSFLRVAALAEGMSRVQARRSAVKLETADLSQLQAQHSKGSLRGSSKGSMAASGKRRGSEDSLGSSGSANLPPLKLDSRSGGRRHRCCAHSPVAPRFPCSCPYSFPSCYSCIFVTAVAAECNTFFCAQLSYLHPASFLHVPHPSLPHSAWPGGRCRQSACTSAVPLPTCCGLGLPPTRTPCA